MSEITNKKYEVTKKDLNKMFWRSMPVELSYNSERMHNLLYVFTLTPVLKKIYKDDPEGMKMALQRHVEFYNTTPQIEPWVLGITAALEVQNAENENNLGDTVTAIKTGLMGPISVIGDTLFFTSGFRVIAASVGSALCIAGNPFGILVYFLIFNVPNYLCHYYGIHLGFKLGTSFIDKVVASGLLKKVTDVALIVGITVLGALTSSYVFLSTKIAFSYDQAVIDLQTIFDGICPNLLPICLTLFCAWIMKKKNVKAPILMATVIIVGVILGALGLI
ncbi:PTS system mannose/fructose/sorbose family transporter subunit IID [Anaerorhabdus sp.]|uniref:PTS system mannose/fructose/sorbose family transporter subunit IID n=1 Tax=Anaerorhabdus sp. TaxID=1872524 RepID=UPI002FC63BD3